VLEFSEFARHDLDETWQYISEGSAEMADSFLDELYAVCELIAANPHVGRSRYDLIVDLRFLPHKNYNIFYFPTERGVESIASCTVRAILFKY